MTHGVMDRAAAHMPETAPRLYGVIAEYDDADTILAAAHQAREAGYRKMDAYTPFPVEGLDEAIGFREVLVPWIMLIGGIVGALFGFGLLYYCMVITYPLDVGGQPLFAWPIYVPITFECTVLFSALSGAFGMFMLNGLPEPYHPVFDAPNFERATSSSFFLCIEAEEDAKKPETRGLIAQHEREGIRYVAAGEVQRFLASTGPVNVAPIERRR